jgi:ornithine carbamoyltransferase
MTGTLRHFLDLDEFDTATLRMLLDRAHQLKRGEGPAQPAAGRTLALVFERPSTRTRVSFEVGIQQLGGQAVVLDAQGSQLGRGETVADTARVLSRYVDLIMLRTDDHDKLRQLAEHATVPVINGLTDRTHPCQVMADILTLEEWLGPAAGKVVAWSGDGNNVAASWIQAAVRFDFELRLACPASLRPRQCLLDWAAAHGARLRLTESPEEAVQGADCVVTDTWVSMNHKETASRHALLSPYQVNEALMAKARPEAIFMHCLPAHRGEEVTDGVMDGPRSAVWDEAENRLHVQKAIMSWCLGV